LAACRTPTRTFDAAAGIGLTEQEQAAVWPEGLDGQDARPHRELAAQVLPQSAEQVADLVGRSGRLRERGYYAFIMGCPGSSELEACREEAPTWRMRLGPIILRGDTDDHAR
jgi:hypothetical protein